MSGFGFNNNGGGGGRGGNTGTIMLGLAVLCACSVSVSAMAVGMGWVPNPFRAPEDDLGTQPPEDLGTTGPETTVSPNTVTGLSNIPEKFVNTRLRFTNLGRYQSQLDRMNLAVASACGSALTNEPDDVSASREVWKLVPSVDKKSYRIQSERTDGCASKYLVVKSGTVMVSNLLVGQEGLWYARTAGRDEMGNGHIVLLHRKATDDKRKPANALAFTGTRTNPKAQLVATNTDNRTNSAFAKWVPVKL